MEVTMTLQQLPERANLEQLKKQAKSLLAAARSQEPNAIALHDAQLVLAREYGFKSWTALKQEVEERSLSFAAAVDEFVRCATGSAPERAMRLLARHAGIANANLYTELVLGDADAVETRLKASPAIARQRGGVQNWEPLLYVCHTFLQKDSPERAKGLVRIARELLRMGSNPNAEYDWNWHPELPRTALWGALIATGQPELAECCSRAAQIRRTAFPRTLRRAVEMLRRWNCCIDSASMLTEFQEAFPRLRTFWVG